MKAKSEIKNKLLLQCKITGHLHKASPAYLLINLLNAAGGAVCYILQILFYQKLIDFILYNSPALPTAALYFFGYQVFCLVYRLFDQWVTVRFKEREKAKVRRYYKKMVYSESAKKKLENYNSEEYNNLLHNAVYNDGEFLFLFADRLCILFGALLCFASVTVIFLRMHPVFLFGALLSALKNCVINSRKDRLDYQIHRDKMPFYRYDTYIHDLFYQKKYVRELRLYPIGSYFIKKYKLLRELRFRVIKKNLIQRGLFILARDGIDLLLQGIYIAVLTYLLINRRVTVGEFHLVLSQVATLSIHIERIIMFLPAVCNDANYSADIFKVFCSENQRFFVVSEGTGEACVVCRDLCFSYDGQREVLKDINICLPLDKKIAIVGENGSGKSTFIKLLMGLYVPQGGSITYHYPGFGGRDCQELFGSLLQEYRIFPLSLKENVLPLAGRMGGKRSKLPCALLECGKNWKNYRKEWIRYLPENFSRKELVCPAGNSRNLRLPGHMRRKGRFWCWTSLPQAWIRKQRAV
ncbi:MAG: ABC transporter ATP-binding protein/permease [Lachnospiraceae bacterium]|nr:ABC transporter ATP-binding protein/permease [Lachnospiraceae bacterium]